MQLNYDGLAQKAGCPQEALMEVRTMIEMRMLMPIALMVTTPEEQVYSGENNADVDTGNDSDTDKG